jgi:hypothetical protein
MASYTDKIPQFNPYVAQLPVDAMVKVGMYKQQKYEEGLEKIQTNIDNVAGLDIANPVQQKYLQSKLNQLGNDLTFVAAGDFSNFQLVNSVNGMTNQIAKDKTVQNAVASTSFLRKQQSFMEKAKREGKSSPENEAFFNNEVSKYLKSTDVKESFNGEYYEYKDVDKKLRDLHSKLKEADVSIDNPYIRDNSGKTLYYDNKGNVSTDPSKGQAKYDYTMLTTTVKGIGAEKILNNFYDSLDETDKRQLNISAQYHYRDSTIDTIQSDIVKTYDEKKKMYSDAIIDASVKLASSELTAEQKRILQVDINKAKALVYEGGFDKQMNDDLLEVDTEEEVSNYRYKTYTQKKLTNLAKDLDNETKSIEYKNNPGRAAILDQKKFEFDVQKERQREQEWSAQFRLNLKKDLREEEEAGRKREEDVKLRPIVATEKIETDFTKYGILDLEKDINTVDANMKSTKNKLALLLAPNAKTPKEREDAVKAANKLYEQYRENPNTINDNTQRQLLEQIDGLDNAQYTLLNKRNAAKQASLPFTEISDKVLNKQGGVRIGQNLYSAKELFDFQTNAGKYIKQYQVRSGGGFELRSQMTDDILKQFKGTKHYPIALALYNSYNKKSLSPGEQVIVNQVDKIYKNTNEEVRGLVKQQRDIESKVINDLSPEFQQTKIQINKENKADMGVVDQIIGIKTKDYNDYGSLDSDNPDDFSSSKIAEMKKNGDFGVTYIKKNDGSAVLVATSGEDVQKIPLTAEEFRNWVTKYSYINPMNDVINNVQSSKSKTTNKANLKQGSTARYTGFNSLLPGINNTKIAPKVRLDIEGSPDNTGNASTDMFQARLYYHTGKNFEDKVLNTGGYLNASQLQLLLNQTGPKTIETLFK